MTPYKKTFILRSGVVLVMALEKISLARAVVAIIIGAGSLAYVAPLASQAGEVGKIKVGAITSTPPMAPAAIAIEKGWFQNEGLDVEVVTFGSGSDMIAALIAGQLQFAQSGVSPQVLNAIARGQPIIGLMSIATEFKGMSAHKFVIRKNLYDKGIRTMAELKGQKLGIEFMGSPASYLLTLLIDKAGLDFKKDFDIILTDSQGKTLAALKAGSIAAGGLGAAVTTEAMARGIGVPVTGLGDEVGKQQLAILMANSRWVRENREGTIRFLKGFLRGTDVYSEAVTKKMSREVAQIMNKHLGGKPEHWIAAVENRAIPPPTLDGVPHNESIIEIQKFFIRIGQMTKIVDPESYVDLSYVKEAKRRLGS